MTHSTNYDTHAPAHKHLAFFLSPLIEVSLAAVCPPVRACGGTKYVRRTFGPAMDTNGQSDGASADVGSAHGASVCVRYFLW